MSSSSKVSILITGVNQGLGKAVAKQLLEQDKTTVHLYAAARSKSKAESTVEELIGLAKKSNSDHKISAVVVDLTDDKSIEELCSQFDTLDILVNNAAINVLDDWSSPSAARKAMMKNFDCNVFGSVCLASAFLPKLQAAFDKKTSKRPALINVTSDLGAFSFMTDPNSPSVMYNYKQFTYPATKSAFNMYTVYAAKVHPDLRIVSVNPGFTATALNGLRGN